MKCKVFCGNWDEAMDAFNEWAKGKALTKDVIIHTLTPSDPYASVHKKALYIVVYHPEGKPWEGEE